MGTVVVGFRLGWDRKGRQATVVLTQAGVLHHSSGLLGLAARPARPHAPAGPDPHPVPRQAAILRRLYADLHRQGYTRELIPPACVRLDTEEQPLHSRPWGEHAPRAHPELIAEFTGAAPAAPGSLEDALTAFYTAIGLTPPGPGRSARPARPRRSGRPCAASPRAVRSPPAPGAARAGPSRALGCACTWAASARTSHPGKSPNSRPP
ncbi:hypothetical protein ABZW02_13710 [Streptomyces sp. NPDC005180]|uniref:hypothetical protein n=1 Tax=Streptomyces sp. NPDC005180 TaxID=3156868 RepID=UPI0033AD8B86